MPKPKKPWRTLMDAPEKAGRFTREQVRQAVLAVKAENEAGAARARKKAARSSAAVELEH